MDTALIVVDMAWTAGRQGKSTTIMAGRPHEPA
jgi:hypothetical protein